MSIIRAYKGMHGCLQHLFELESDLLLVALLSVRERLHPKLLSDELILIHTRLQACSSCVYSQHMSYCLEGCAIGGSQFLVAARHQSDMFQPCLRCIALLPR